MKILAIIPARGGSKGIPMKNIAKLAGRPLIKYTIDTAKKSHRINRIAVSTNDPKIAKVAKSLGADVPFLRPKKISGDDATTYDAIKHTLDFFASNENYFPDIVVILQPTSPLRTSQMIDKSLTLLEKTNATSVISVHEIKTHPFSSFWYDGKYMRPFRSDFSKFYQRQKYPDLYYPTGDVYTFWYSTLKKYHSIYGPRIKPLIIRNEISIDIDEKFDLFICEMVLKYWKNYSKRLS